LNSSDDDGIVVGRTAMAPITREDYLGGPETLRRRDVVGGVVRDAPAPAYSHQRTVTDLVCLLQAHVRAHGLGHVCVAPVDVVLDTDNVLVVQPDLIFVSRDRLGIVRNQVWGAPDLVVEVLSPGTRRHDLQDKLGWYAHYGVRECWLVDKDERAITVHVFSAGHANVRAYGADDDIASNVLPQFQLRVRDAFDATHQVPWTPSAT
jgi:Uma2 family endonuclease